MENKKLLLTGMALIATLTLAGCATTPAEEPTTTNSASPTPSESGSSDGDGGGSTTSPNAGSASDYSKMTPEQFLALAEEGINAEAKAKFDAALTKSIAEADSKGMIEVYQSLGEPSYSEFHLPAGSANAVSFIVDKEGEPIKDTIETLPKEFSNLSNLDSGRIGGDYAGYALGKNGEVKITIKVSDGEKFMTFVYILYINDAGIIEKMYSSGDYKLNAPIVETKLSYETDAEAVAMLKKLESGS